MIKCIVYIIPYIKKKQTYTFQRDERLSYKYLRSIIWFKHILLARTVDIIKQMLTILKLQGLEWKQHAYISII